MWLLVKLITIVASTFPSRHILSIALMEVDQKGKVESSSYLYIIYIYIYIYIILYYIILYIILFYIHIILYFIYYIFTYIYIYIYII